MIISNTKEHKKEIDSIVSILNALVETYCNKYPDYVDFDSTSFCYYERGKEIELNTADDELLDTLEWVFDEVIPDLLEKPENNAKSLLDKAKDLLYHSQQICFLRLSKYNPKIKSVHLDRYGYRISEDIRNKVDFDYTELIKDGDDWILVDSDGYQYSIFTLSTDTLCILTNLLTERK